jgi:hypothetical protein
MSPHSAGPRSSRIWRCGVHAATIGAITSAASPYRSSQYRLEAPEITTQSLFARLVECDERVAHGRGLAAVRGDGARQGRGAAVVQELPRSEAHHSGIVRHVSPRPSPAAPGRRAPVPCRATADPNTGLTGTLTPGPGNEGA